MAGHAAAHGEDALSHEHAAEVFGRGLYTHQDDFLLLLCPCFSVIGLEYYLAGGCTGACGKTLGHYFGAFEGVFVEDGVQQLVEFVRLHAQKGGLLVDFACAEKLHGDAYHGYAGAFAVAGLEHPEFAVLDGELHVLHIFVIVLKFVGYADELGSAVGHCLFKSGIFSCAFLFADTLQGSPAARALDGDLLRSANAGYHVFALSVDEVFAVEDVFACGGVAAEGYAGG